MYNYVHQANRAEATIESVPGAGACLVENLASARLQGAHHDEAPGEGEHPWLPGRATGKNLSGTAADASSPHLRCIF